jgi:hypothetical protein
VFYGYQGNCGVPRWNGDLSSFSSNKYNGFAAIQGFVMQLETIRELYLYNHWADEFALQFALLAIFLFSAPPR